MSERKTQNNHTLSEVYAGLSVIRFLAEEYEGQIDTDDLATFEEQVLHAKKYADELAEIARNSN